MISILVEIERERDVVVAPTEDGQARTFSYPYTGRRCGCVVVNNASATCVYFGSVWVGYTTLRVEYEMERSTIHISFYFSKVSYLLTRIMYIGFCL